MDGLIWFGQLIACRPADQLWDGRLNLGDPDGLSLKEDEYAKQSLQGERSKHSNGSRMAE
ncbi:MAG: hypothetical protein HQL80_11925 [Magnetococcales bacterium]|nr:hypothetical protein [Magnetococcales bacterium]